MIRPEASVKRETGYIAAATGILSLLTQAVFLIIGKWELPVLWGNLLSAAAGILNFFLMGLTVQAAVSKEKKEAASLMRLSQTLRLLLLGGAAVLGVVLPCFSIWTAIIPLFFPRIALAVQPVIDPKVKEAPAVTASSADTEEEDDDDDDYNDDFLTGLHTK